MVADDPILTNPEHYRLLWENDLVRVLEYDDMPGDKTTPHDHPDTVLITLTSFSRALSSGGAVRNVDLAAGTAVWLPAQRHSGENIGDTATRTILVELKGSETRSPNGGSLGPDMQGSARQSPAIRSIDSL